jgi:hypothetical protein
MVSVRRSRVVGVALAVLACAGPARAQVPAATAGAGQTAQAPADVQLVRDELERLRREFELVRRSYDERLRQLEQRLVEIGGGPLTAPPPPAMGPDAAKPAPAPPGDTPAQTPVPIRTSRSTATSSPPPGATRSRRSRRSS